METSPSPQRPPAKRRRSSGARPKKAVAPQVNALRAQLAQLRSHEWIKAQLIFDEMCMLCEVTGPTGGKMIPRACRFCDHFGHNRDKCPKWRARCEAMTEREMALDVAQGYVPPQCAEEVRPPGVWEEIVAMRAIVARNEEGERLGIGEPRDPACKRTEGADCAAAIVLGCDCSSCVSWNEFMGPALKAYCASCSASRSS
jgi:hypothetical protein